MNYVCDAMSLAKYTVTKCEKDNHPISNLQLQKILYFLQSVYCRNTKGDLLFVDNFEAWPYGPVVPNVYEAFSEHGGQLIHKVFEDVPSFNYGVKSFIDDGIRVLRAKSPWDLVSTTHAPGSPWDQTWQDGVGFKKAISNDLIISAALSGAN